MGLHKRTESGTIPTPSAGSDFTYPFSQIERVRLVSLVAKLQTSSTAGGRQAALTFTDRAGNTVAVVAPTAAVTASNTVYFCWSHIGTQYATGDYQGDTLYQLPLPRIWLDRAWAVASSTGNLQAGDQWSALTWAAEFDGEPFSGPELTEAATVLGG